MSNTLHENIYDNLQQNFTNQNNKDTSDSSGEQVNDFDNDLEVVLRDRKDSVEIKTNRQKHKKHKSWNQRKLNEINSKYFSDENDINCDENSDKENSRSQKNRRSKSVGFVIKNERNSDDSYETADENDSADEVGIDVLRSSFTAQVQVIPSQEPLEDNDQTTLCRNKLRKFSDWLTSASNHYYPTTSSNTTASAPFEQQYPVTKPAIKCTSNEKTYISVSSDEPESFSETETDDEFLPKKKIGWNPPTIPPLPPLPPEVNLPSHSTHSKVDVSSFLQKKSLAQGMMDLALLSANTNQLRYVLDSRNTHPYYLTSLSLICFSLFLQILVGLSLIWNSQYNVRRKSELKTADRLNNISVVGVFLISITNVFISTFGGSTNGQVETDMFESGNDFENDSNGSAVDNLELI